MAREDRAELGPVSDEGDEVRRRRERLGLDIGQLAGQAGINRDTLSAIERGSGFRRISLTKIENALSRLETEVGFNAPPREPAAAAAEPPQTERRRRSTDVVIVRLKNDAGEVAVEGPIEDLDALQAAATRMLRSLAETAEVERPDVTLNPDL